MFPISFAAAGLLFVLPFTSGFCGSRLPHVHDLVRRAEGEAPAFGYGTENGPLNWANLDTAFATCSTGSRQSPIILNNEFLTATPGSVKLDLPAATNVLFENLGTTVEVVTNGTLTASDDVSGSTWELAQFHFHTPSEHRVDLAHADEEMHMVFKAANNPEKVAVAAFMLDVSEGETTSMLETVFSQLGEVQELGSSTTIPSLDFADFVNSASNQSFFRYMGSLTTPPCTEGVEWYVAQTPIPLSAATYLKLKATTKTNNRFSQNAPLQPNILSFAGPGKVALEALSEGANATSSDNDANLDVTLPEVAASSGTVQDSALQSSRIRINPLVPVKKRRLAKDH